MANYFNVMEMLVEDQMDKTFDTLDCCHCEHCRDDIVAYALNQLPPKYVVSETGRNYSKLFILESQHVADILSAISAGANIVREHPRH